MSQHPNSIANHFKPGHPGNTVGRPRHGHTVGYKSTPTHLAWKNMKARCYQLSNNRYSSYGARGIAVCDRWRESFEAFLADMGEAPTDYQLERKDNDGPYCPDNCRWASRKDQCRNTRRSKRITLNGDTKTLVEWSLITGIKRETIAYRLKNGWTVERALGQV